MPPAHALAEVPLMGMGQGVAAGAGVVPPDSTSGVVPAVPAAVMPPAIGPPAVVLPAVGPGSAVTEYDLCGGRDSPGSQEGGG